MVHPDRTPTHLRMTSRSLKVACGSALLCLAVLAGAAAQSPTPRVDTFGTGGVEIGVSPAGQMSVVIDTSAGVIYTDPTGGAQRYAGYPEPDIILISHEHHEHYDAGTLEDLITSNTRIVVPPYVMERLPESLKASAVQLANGEDVDLASIKVEAIAAHGLGGPAEQWHPRGRGNGYVVTVDRHRLYVAGSTEAVPEMLQLQDIYLAFLPLYPPYALGPDDAVRAVSMFQSEYTYIYQYNSTRTRDDFLRTIAAAASATTVVAPDIP